MVETLLKVGCIVQDSGIAVFEWRPEWQLSYYLRAEYSEKRAKQVKCPWKQESGQTAWGLKIGVRVHSAWGMWSGLDDFAQAIGTFIEILVDPANNLRCILIERGGHGKVFMWRVAGIGDSFLCEVCWKWTWEVKWGVFFFFFKEWKPFYLIIRTIQHKMMLQKRGDEL